MANSRLCSIPDCGKPVKGRGWCSKHYYSLRDGPQCSVQGCDSPAKARGFCNAHWRRWRRHGDPLGGDTAYGVPADYLQRTVLMHEKDECLTWPYASDPKGYGRLQGKSVTRIICEFVNGPAPTPKHQAAHSCGNGHLGCCAPNHLSWKTRSENEADKVEHGTHNRGSQHPLSKITECDVLAIREMDGKSTLLDIGNKFGVSPITVHNILKRKSWTHV